MRWRVQPKDKRLPHLWFAWRPVKVGLTWVWLENVRRRRVSRQGLANGTHYDTWEYTLLENVLY